MKTEKMIMARFGLKFGDAKRIVSQARQNLTLQPSCAWTEELEEESCRLCSEEGDNNHRTDSDAAQRTHESVSTAAATTVTSSSPRSITSTSGPPTATATNETKNAPLQHMDSSENIGCWTPRGSQKAKISSRHVADLQHETLLEGASVKREAPRIPVRKGSDPNLDEIGGMDSGGDAQLHHDVDSDSNSYSDDNEDMPLPVIRPLRRTDSRTKHA